MCAGAALALAGAVPRPGLLPQLAWALPLLVALLAVQGGRGPAAGLLWPAAWLLAGWMGAAGAAQTTARDCRHALRDGSRVAFHGTLASLPVIDGNTLLLAEELGSGRPSSAGEAGGQARPAMRRSSEQAGCAGMIRLRLRERHAGLEPGAEVTGTGRWLRSRYAHPLVPERAGMVLVDAVSAETSRHQHHALLAVRSGAQRRLRALFGRRAAAVEALLLARKEGLDPDLRDRYAAAGMAHLLAISGLHIGLIAAVVLAGFFMAGLSATKARIAAAVVVAVYVGFIGAPASAVRACLMLGLLLASRLLQRPSSGLGIVSAAAIFMLAWDPLNIADPGFQLSFAGVSGIVLLRPVLMAHLPTGVPHWLRESLAVSAAATLATAPIAALHFQQVAPVGLVSNLIGIPLAGMVVPAAALSLLTSLVWLPLGAFLAQGTGLLIDLMGAVAAFFAHVPMGHLTVSEAQAGSAAMLTLVAAIGAGALPRADRFLRRRRIGVRRPVRWAVGVSTAGCVMIWAPLVAGADATGAVEIHMIDVGQGDAIAVRSPAGRWLLIDTGPRTPTFDAGAEVVVPYLRGQGARRLEALVLTHPHADHIGGAAAVLEHMDVQLLLDPGIAWGRSMHAELLREAARDSMTWLAAREGRSLRFDGLQLDVLHPQTSLEATDDVNEESVVIRLRYAGSTVLFMGDSGAPVEARLVREYGRLLDAQVLKVGHHGSRTSSTLLFLETVDPEFALVSAGRFNRFGHPHRVVLSRFDQLRVRVLRTDSAGAVVLRLERDRPPHVLPD